MIQADPPERLHEFQGERIRVTATVVKRSRSPRNIRATEGKIRMLVSDIALESTDELLQSHTWIRPPRIISGTLPGARIAFTATVVGYPGKDGEAKYGLENVKQVTGTPNSPHPAEMPEATPKPQPEAL